ncbi:Gfo/Idh/MocA family protein [Lacibacter sediminis]|uniref:Gfo/Idh/MocA family oxidoreductase n=1 Tax=Lacibacter sediminis TaxID=2760713 RepID=A0A7G5XIQ0_9BACT|nr:Gfo/Idh/MocA family oxidoreductase [Lacibacter sediminis]QNA45353.1 Gfo/Idh/MocA family oxidoreductase [Lacibacter sediminis]
MQRRNFIRQSGLLTAGLLLHQQMLNAYSSPVSVKNISIGIIGCGDRGVGLGSVVNSMPEQFQIKAVCDVLAFRLDQAKKLDKQNNIRYEKDYRKLLDDKTIDAVIIATPLHNHYEIAAAAISAGKHVYLEKTMTYDAEQSLALVKLMQQHPKQILQVGHQYRYTPLYFKVKELIDKGYLGKVTQIDCRWDRNWNWRRAVPQGYTDKQVNWRMYKEYSGGLPAELLSHQVDFINWAFNTHPDEILGTGGIDYYKDGRETFDNVQTILRYNKEGMIGNFGATCGNEKDGYLFKLKGTKGTIQLLMNDGIFFPEKQTKSELETVDGVTGATKIEWNKEGGIPILKEKLKDGSWYALKEFHKTFTENSKPVSNVITGATTAFCVHLMNQSIYKHSIETWKPEFNLL